jgi:hypothetical protein
MKIKMNSSTSYRSWIGFNDNSDGGIAVYSVACYLSQGLQVDVFAFEHDAYLYLVDQAEGLTDEQRIELGQLAELSDRDAFWDLFNKSVSPLTSYRIESHTLRRHYCAGASSDLSSDFISCDSKRQTGFDPRARRVA